MNHVFTSKAGILDLGAIVFVQSAQYVGQFNLPLLYSPDGVFWIKTKLVTAATMVFDHLAVRFIKTNPLVDFTLTVTYGEGYQAKPDEAWNKLFHRTSHWTGGDGLYMFNLKGGVEASDMQDHEVKTLMVFGDTLVSTLHPITKQRLEPLVMPNSSLAVLAGTKPVPEKIEFLINHDEKGRLLSFMDPTVDLAFQGPIAAHIVREGFDSGVKNPWVSSYHPKQPITVTFDLYKAYVVDRLTFTNYAYPEFPQQQLENRGLKEVTLMAGNDRNHLQKLLTITLPKAHPEKNLPFAVDLNTKVAYRYFQLVIPQQDQVGNYGGVTGDEGLFGLNHLRFYVGDDYLRFVHADANSELYKASKQAHYWLQDGVLIEDKLYFFPLVVAGDPTGPEGFQFKIEGIAMLEVPVENEHPRFEKITQYDTNFYTKDEEGREWYWGAGIFTNTEKTKAVHPDGYIYIYGYTFLFAEIEAGRKLRVARVKPESFANLNEWRYFDGSTWQTNPQKAKSLLDHVSCEMSVHDQDGQYVAVFTYDVQSPYLTYATAPTPWGPFSEPRIIYVAPDRGKRIYQYNAKAHPHLRNQREGMLVSYNQNTASMDENMSNGTIYGPRFLRLTWNKDGKAS